MKAGAWCSFPAKPQAAGRAYNGVSHPGFGNSAMRVTMLKGKIHRATVTEANVDYEGSLTVDSTLLEASGILPWELIHVWDVTRGTRLVTYAMSGEPNSGVMCVNGAGAHLVHPGDLVIVAA